MDKATFMAKFGAVFEHSPWVADSVFESSDGLPDDAETLGLLFESTFLASDPGKQLTTLRAHPQLACALAEPEELTYDSINEQSGAELDKCSAAEFKEFSELNTGYYARFGFPFIIAVKGWSRLEILKFFRDRLDNDKQTEYQTALRQTCRIAKFRIMDILNAR